MKRKWKIIMGVALVAVVLVIVSLQYTQGVEAKLLKVEPRTIAQTFKEEGVVTAEKEYPFYALFSSKIINLPIKEGQVVEQGELLAEFDTRELQYQLAQIQGQIKSIQAEQELQKSVISLDKMRELYEAGAISQKEYEDARNKINSNYYTGLLESLNAQAASVQYKIDESSIHAPVQGIVAGLDVQEGMVVVPGQRIMTIVPRGEYLIKVYVLTEDAAKIKPGMEVELVLDNKEKEIVFPGRVEELAPSAIEKTSALGLIEQRIKVTVKAAFPPELDLRPGYALDVHFTTQKQLNKLVVPKTAVFPYEGGDAVWVARENRARIQPVSLGLENDREVAIEEGLQPGDLIILNPQLEGLAAGKKIRN